MSSAHCWRHSASPTARVRSLTPELVKGLEFDLVVLVDPDRFGDGIEGSVDRYVAMTRATRQLVVLTRAGQVPHRVTRMAQRGNDAAGSERGRGIEPTFDA